MYIVCSVYFSYKRKASSVIFFLSFVHMFVVHTTTMIDSHIYICVWFRICGSLFLFFVSFSVRLLPWCAFALYSVWLDETIYRDFIVVAFNGLGSCCRCFVFFHFFFCFILFQLFLCSIWLKALCTHFAPFSTVSLCARDIRLYVPVLFCCDDHVAGRMCLAFSANFVRPFVLFSHF